MDLNSITSQVYPRAVNGAGGGQSRRDHSDGGERKAAQQAATSPKPAEPARGEAASPARTATPSDSQRPRASEFGAHQDRQLAFHAKAAGEEVQRHEDKPSTAHPGHDAPATVARRAERSYLAQVPTEQGRIIDEMV